MNKNEIALLRARWQDAASLAAATASLQETIEVRGPLDIRGLPAGPHWDPSFRQRSVSHLDASFTDLPWLTSHGKFTDCHFDSSKFYGGYMTKSEFVRCSFVNSKLDWQAVACICSLRADAREFWYLEKRAHRAGHRTHLRHA